MRLTLRNLLRFLDRTHESAQERQRLEELVADSESAEAWIDRIRRLRSDPEKPAPPIDGQPSPSRVALYLDGALSEQETVAFEEKLLASDEILAEVASAHQIIRKIQDAATATVPIGLRQVLYDLDRLYGVSQRGASDAAMDEGEADGVPASMDDLPFDDDETAPSPDSLETESDDDGDHYRADRPPVSLDQMQRAARGRSWLIAASMILVLGMSFGLTYWAGWMAANSRRVASVIADPQIERPDNNNGAIAKDAETQPDKPDLSPSPEGKNENPPPAKGDSAKDSPNDDKGKAGGRVDNLFADREPPLSHPTPPPVGDAVAVDREPPAEGSGVRPDISFSLAGGVESVPFLGPPQPPRMTARVTAPNPLCLVRSADEDEWRSMTRSSAVFEGDHVKVFTGGVAEFELGTLLKMSVKGPAEFVVAPRDVASEAEVLELKHGEISVQSNEGDVDWMLQVGTDRYRITMALASSVIMARVEGWLPPGSDPRTVEPAVARTIHAIGGRCLVQLGDSSWRLSAGDAVVQVESPAAEWRIAPRSGQVANDVDPRRYVSRLTTIVDNEIREWIADRADVAAMLVDLKLDVRQEIRLAAMTWLAEEGNFDYVVDYLENPENNANWRTFIEALRQTIYNRPELAENLFRGLVFAGESQTELYELIVGISAADLASGADARLVELLSSSDLAIRILAIENLREINGGVTYGYTATKPEKERERIVNRQWKPRLAKQIIRYEQPPSVPLTELSVGIGEVPGEGGLDALDKDQ